MSSKENFDKWNEIRYGGSEAPVRDMKIYFNAKAAVVDARAESLKKQLDASSDAERVYVGPQGESLYILK